MSHLYPKLRIMVTVRGDDVKGQVSFQKQNQINIILNNQTENNQSMESTFCASFDIIETTFADIIGLDRLKEEIKEMYAAVLINQERERLGLKIEKQARHMLFKGNPGTGKTTIARQLAYLFREMRILSKGHFIEADRADLVGEYIGHTAKKTKELVAKSLGGILFIDEAYALARGGEKDFGKEAIDTLVKQMEDHHDQFILILAGYPDEMDYFLSVNPGLRSRFPFILTFDDYSVDQLIEIANKMAQARDYRLSQEAIWKLRSNIAKQIKSNSNHAFANGRFVRNIIEKSIRKQAVRLVNRQHYTVEELMILTAKDIMIE